MNTYDVLAMISELNDELVSELIDAVLCPASTNPKKKKKKSKTVTKLSYIKDVRFSEAKGVTIVKFNNGDVQKATVQDGDTFDKKTGVAICLIKHMYSGLGNFDKLCGQIVDIDTQRIKDAEAKKAQEVVIAQARAKKQAKRQARKQKKTEAFAKAVARNLANTTENNKDAK